MGSFLVPDDAAGAFDADPDASESINDLMSMCAIQGQRCSIRRFVPSVLSQGLPHKQDSSALQGHVSDPQLLSQLETPWYSFKRDGFRGFFERQVLLSCSSPHQGLQRNCVDVRDDGFELWGASRDVLGILTRCDELRSQGGIITSEYLRSIPFMHHHLVSFKYRL